MVDPKAPVTPEALEAAAQESQLQHYVLVLYVAGMTARSQQAIQNVSRICRENLEGRYSLQVVDIYQQPELAEEANILAAPTLLKKIPLPLRRIIGDMVAVDKVLVGLGLSSVANDGGPTRT